MSSSNMQQQQQDSPVETLSPTKQHLATVTTFLVTPPRTIKQHILAPDTLDTTLSLASSNGSVASSSSSSSSSSTLSTTARLDLYLQNATTNLAIINDNQQSLQAVGNDKQKNNAAAWSSFGLEENEAEAAEAEGLLTWHNATTLAPDLPFGPPEIARLASTTTSDLNLSRTCSHDDDDAALELAAETSETIPWESCTKQIVSRASLLLKDRPLKANMSVDRETSNRDEGNLQMCCDGAAIGSFSVEPPSATSDHSLHSHTVVSGKSSDPTQPKDDDDDNPLISLSNCKYATQVLMVLTVARGAVKARQETTMRLLHDAHIKFAIMTQESDQQLVNELMANKWGLLYPILFCHVDGHAQYLADWTDFQKLFHNNKFQSLIDERVIEIQTQIKQTKDNDTKKWLEAEARKVEQGGCGDDNPWNQFAKAGCASALMTSNDLNDVDDVKTNSKTLEVTPLDPNIISHEHAIQDAMSNSQDSVDATLDITVVGTHKGGMPAGGTVEYDAAADSVSHTVPEVDDSNGFNDQHDIELHDDQILDETDSARVVCDNLSDGHTAEANTEAIDAPTPRDISDHAVERAVEAPSGVIDRHTAAASVASVVAPLTSHLIVEDNPFPVVKLSASSYTTPVLVVCGNSKDYRVKVRTDKAVGLLKQEDNEFTVVSESTDGATYAELTADLGGMAHPLVFVVYKKYAKFWGDWADLHEIFEAGGFTQVVETQIEIMRLWIERLENHVILKHSNKDVVSHQEQIALELASQSEASEPHEVRGDDVDEDARELKAEIGFVKDIPSSVKVDNELPSQTESQREERSIARCHSLRLDNMSEPVACKSCEWNSCGMDVAATVVTMTPFIGDKTKRSQPTVFTIDEQGHHVDKKFKREKKKSAKCVTSPLSLIVSERTASTIKREDTKICEDIALPLGSAHGQGCSQNNDLPVELGDIPPNDSIQKAEISGAVVADDQSAAAIDEENNAAVEGVNAVALAGDSVGADRRELDVTPFTTMKRAYVDHTARMPTVTPLECFELESEALHAIDEGKNAAVGGDNAIAMAGDSVCADEQELDVTPFTTMKRAYVDHTARMPTVTPLECFELESEALHAIDEEKNAAVEGDNTLEGDSVCTERQELDVTPFTTMKRSYVDHTARIPTVAPLECFEFESEVVNQSRVEIADALPMSMEEDLPNRSRVEAVLESRVEIADARLVSMEEDLPNQSIVASQADDGADSSQFGDVSAAATPDLDVTPFTSRKVVRLDHSARLPDASKLDMRNGSDSAKPDTSTTEAGDQQRLLEGSVPSLDFNASSSFAENVLSPSIEVFDEAESTELFAQNETVHNADAVSGVKCISDQVSCQNAGKCANSCNPSHHMDDSEANQAPTPIITTNPFVAVAHHDLEPNKTTERARVEDTLATTWFGPPIPAAMECAIPINYEAVSLDEAPLLYPSSVTPTPSPVSAVGFSQVVPQTKEKEDLPMSSWFLGEVL
ncbi:hypothetical protein MPSEU_000754200 [Mayamaea pseudoterrestris]|nr:hypothetical protein MPSEU_000754200 [Mayamaea pseudoterrestris]